MWYEHWHRYHYVLPLVAGKSVLDVACGEGYGSALMSSRAALVTGTDVSHAAIAHGQATYAGCANLRLVEASCTSLPFDAESFDVVVSFETIEHIADQATFLDEIKRILKPDGLLILSSPNKAEYSDKRNYSNEFHVNELYREQLEVLLEPRFAVWRWLSQRNLFASLIVPEGEAEDLAETSPLLGESITVSQANPERLGSPLPALYYIVLAAQQQATLAACNTRVSIFSDSEEWAYKDYYDAYRNLRDYQQREQDLTTHYAALQAECDRLKAAAQTQICTPEMRPPGLFGRLKKLFS